MLICWSSSLWLLGDSSFWRKLAAWAIFFSKEQCYLHLQKATRDFNYMYFIWNLSCLTCLNKWAIWHRLLFKISIVFTCSLLVTSFKAPEWLSLYSYQNMALGEEVYTWQKHYRISSPKNSVHVYSPQFLSKPIPNHFPSDAVLRFTFTYMHICIRCS